MHNDSPGPQLEQIEIHTDVSLIMSTATKSVVGICPRDHWHIDVVWIMGHGHHQATVGPEGLTHCFMWPRIHPYRTIFPTTFGHIGGIDKNCCPNSGRTPQCQGGLCKTRKGHWSLGRKCDPMGKYFFFVLMSYLFSRSTIPNLMT